MVKMVKHISCIIWIIQWQAHSRLCHYPCHPPSESLRLCPLNNYLQPIRQFITPRLPCLQHHMRFCRFYWNTPTVPICKLPLAAFADRNSQLQKPLGPQGQIPLLSGSLFSNPECALSLTNSQLHLCTHTTGTIKTFSRQISMYCGTGDRSSLYGTQICLSLWRLAHTQQLQGKRE